mgnify:CR=1 FL=1
MAQADAHVEAGFQWEFSKEAYGNYLVLTLPDSVKLIPYQARLLQENPHPGLIPFEVQRSDHCLKLYYQLAGRITFLQYVQKEDTAPAQIIAALDRIGAILMESKNLLLYPAGFFLQAEYIFLEPHPAEVSLIYVPVKPLAPGLLADVQESFRHLLKNVFCYRKDLPPEILTWCDEENFQLYRLRERLKELKFSDWKKAQPASGVKEKPFQLTDAFTDAKTEAMIEARAAAMTAATTEAMTGAMIDSIIGSMTGTMTGSATEATSGGIDAAPSVVSLARTPFLIWSGLPRLGKFGLFLLLQLLLTTFLFLSFPQVFNFREEPTSLVGTGLILAAANVLFLRKLN